MGNSSKVSPESSENLKSFQKNQFNSQATIGFRAWKVHTSDFKGRSKQEVTHNNQLLPLFFHHSQSNKIDSYPFQKPWKRVEQAECEKNHLSPDSNCSCGLYAFNTLEQALRQVAKTKISPWLSYLGYKENSQNTFYVVGLVLGSGKVEKYNSGWRAEKSQIISLCSFDPKHKKETQSIAEKLQVHFVLDCRQLKNTYQELHSYNSSCLEFPKTKAQESRLQQAIDDYLFGFFKMTMASILSWLPIVFVALLVTSFFVSTVVTNFLVLIILFILLYRPLRFTRESRKAVAALLE